MQPKEVDTARVATPHSSKRPRPGGEHAARPRIAQDVTRIVATAAALSASTQATITVEAAVNAAADALAGLQRDTDTGRVAIAAMVAAATAATDTALTTSAARLAARCGTTTVPAHRYQHPNSQRAVLRAAGCPGIAVTDTALAAHAEQPAVADLVAHRALLAVAATVADPDGRLRAHLAAIWDATVETRPLEETIAAHTRAGIDGERAAMAAIAAEALRHDRLLWSQANKLARTFDRDPADLRGWGWHGLITALRKYDPDRCLFSTYAVPKISGAIRDGVRSEDPLPKRLTTFRRKVSAATDTLAAELGRGPTLAELAAALDAPREHIELIPRLESAASIDELTAADRVSGPPAALTDTRDPGVGIVELAARDAIDVALAALPEEDATAVRLLILEDVPLAEARARTGATTRQLRMRQRRALAALEEHLADWADLVAV